jgi:hypothetical protein
MSRAESLRLFVLELRDVAVATARIGRRGLKAALVSFPLFFILAVVIAGVIIGALSWFLLDQAKPSGLASNMWFMIAFTVGSFSSYAVALALFEAGPLAAFGLAAVGEEPRIGRTIKLGLLAAARLAPAYFVLFIVPLIAISGMFGPIFRPGFDPVVGAISIASAVGALVWLHARFLTLWQVATTVRSVPGARPASTWRLGRGRFPLLFIATIAPFAIIAAARPSEAGTAALESAGSGLGTAIETFAAIAGFIVFLFVRAALAAATYARCLEAHAAADTRSA